MIDKPGDLVMIFVLSALVITVFGLAYTDVGNLATKANDSTTLFANMTEYATSGNFVKGASDDWTSAQSLENEPQSEEGFIKSAGTALLKTGKVWSSITHAMGDFEATLRIPSEIIAILTTGILITSGLAIYLWFRGKQ